VDRLAPGLLCSGWAATPDGLIESVEAVEAGRWVFGVQWHPEGLVALDQIAGSLARRLFEAFVLAVEQTPGLRS
jgi:gamma-glutamyl-gamma-aminobutyrate hydrolase PuuD